MTKFENLLIILRLFSSRRIVPIRMVEKECCVTERTAYRYIDSLTRAGFPIYYDRNVSGYRILKSRLIAELLTGAELAATYMGTLLLEHVAGDKSLRAVRKAKAKIESIMSSRLSDSLPSTNQTLFSAKVPPPLRECVTIIFLLNVADSNSRVRINFLNPGDENEDIEIKQPKILYDYEWVVGDELSLGKHRGIPIRLIQEIDIIPENAVAVSEEMYPAAKTR